MAEIAVIIPSYERPELLKEALECLIAQSFSDWEAIIIDGSPGITGFTFPDERIRYYRENDLGISGLAQARDCAIRMSSARYIAYLDDDEYYYPTKLEVMWNFLEREASGVFAYHDVVVSVLEKIEGRYRRVGVPRPHWHPEGDPNQLIRDCCFIAGLQVMHTRELYLRAGGFRQDRTRGIFQGKYRSPANRFDEDADLFRRMAEHSRLDHLPLQLAEYRVHGDNVNAWGIDYQEVLRERRLKKACY